MDPRQWMIVITGTPLAQTDADQLGIQVVRGSDQAKISYGKVREAARKLMEYADMMEFPSMLPPSPPTPAPTPAPEKQT